MFFTEILERSLVCELVMAMRWASADRAKPYRGDVEISDFHRSLNIGNFARREKFFSRQALCQKKMSEPKCAKHLSGKRWAWRFDAESLHRRRKSFVYKTPQEPLMLIEFHNKLAIPKVETNDITWIYFSLTSK